MLYFYAYTVKSAVLASNLYNIYYFVTKPPADVEQKSVPSEPAIPVEGPRAYTWANVTTKIHSWVP